MSFSQISGHQFKSVWRPYRFSFFGRSTHYSPAIPEGASRLALHASSHNAASGIMRIIRIKPDTLPVLSWRWRVDTFPEVSREGSKKGDDYAARIYILFSTAQPLSQAAPPTTVFTDTHTHAINYIWARELPLNQHLPSPFDSRSQMLVASSGDTVGQWINVSRNLADDYRTIFKKEPPPIAAIAIMTDSDNSDSFAEAWYGDIVFSNTPPEHSVSAAPEPK